MVCKEGYFGPDCGCTPQDDSTGHFTCDEDGTIVCLPCYQNTATNCVEEVITPDPITTTVTATTDNIPTTVSIVTDFNTSEMGSTRDAFTTVNVSKNDGDIVPIVAGGVAGGLVILLLILIVNILVVIKIKYTKHYSSKQGNMLEVKLF